MFHDKYTLDDISDNDSDKSAKKDTSRKMKLRRMLQRKKTKIIKIKIKTKQKNLNNPKYSRITNNLRNTAVFITGYLFPGYYFMILFSGNKMLLL